MSVKHSSVGIETPQLISADLDNGFGAAGLVTTASSHRSSSRSEGWAAAARLIGIIMRERRFFNQPFGRRTILADGLDQLPFLACDLVFGHSGHAGPLPRARPPPDEKPAIEEAAKGFRMPDNLRDRSAVMRDE
jgi:hypothetical protein